MREIASNATQMATGSAPSSRGWFGGLGRDGRQLAIGVVVILIAIIGADLFGNGYWIHNFRLLGVLLTVAFFQNFLMVDAGQTSFGQGAVFGAAAYAAAILAGIHGVPYPLAALAAVLTAVVFGLAFALPALRVQGYYLGFVTFGAAIVFPEAIVALEAWTNGINGIPLSLGELSRPALFGISPLSAMIAAVACLSLAFHVLVRRTPFGRALRVAAVSSEAAQSLGINPGLLRSIAFIIAAVGTGFAGALYAPVVGFVGPSAFHIELSVLFFFAVIVGGRGHPIGPLVGMLLIYLLPNMLLAEIVNFRLLIYGTIALVVMLVFPEGLVGSVEAFFQKRRRTDNPAIDFRLDRLVLPTKAVGSAANAPVVVQVKGGRKTFGQVVALDNVDFEVRRGEIHGLIGANGSGKTSLLNVLSGFSRLSAGTLKISGIDAAGMPAHRIARLGLGRTFQTPRVFDALTTWENLEIGLDNHVGSKESTPTDVVNELRRELGDLAIEFVPHGQRRILEVLRTVLRGADIVLLDEPAAGLSIRERDEFATLLRNACADGTKTIILVEHDLDLVLDIADRITVLKAGKMVATGTPAEITANPAVKSLFIGGEHA